MKIIKFQNGKKLTKILTMGVALIMCLWLFVFSLAACQGSELSQYKITANGLIDDYISSKNQSDYTADNWAVLQQAVTDGKNAVYRAGNKSGVDTAVTLAKAAIDAVEREDANLEWTNDTAVYVFVKAGFESDILQNVEGAFETLNFQKVYVAEKNVNTWTPLMLLFILDESGISNQQELIDLLSQDSRINHASKSRDLPFETVDTRYIDKTKDTIAVGETLTLEAKGSIDYYVQPFGFKGLLIKPTTNKTYTVIDFPVDLKSVETRDNGWLYLGLATEGYFEVIKAADILSRLSTIEKVELDRSEIVSPPPPIWQISDNTIVEFVAGVQWDDYPKAVIRGLKAGKVTVDFNGVTCEITVV